MAMSSATMAEKQRMAFEALQCAKREGKTLTAYAKAHGLEIRKIYYSLACLRRQGLLPTGVRTWLYPTYRAALSGAMTTSGVACLLIFGTIESVRRRLRERKRKNALP
jgi:hypothetical protein